MERGPNSVTITIPLQLESELEQMRIKQYQDVDWNTMFCDLVARGIQSTQEGTAKEKL